MFLCGALEPIIDMLFSRLVFISVFVDENKQTFASSFFFRRGKFHGAKILDSVFVLQKISV